jgi:hypothetical protein
MFVPFVQQLGMTPDKLLKDKSRVSNELLTPNISHTCQIVPLNKLLDRSKFLELGGKRGKGHEKIL